MNKVTTLIEGYVKRLPSGSLKASPSTVLIQTSRMRIIADPGANPGLLLESLCRCGLAPRDIDTIFLTHYHPDHILNIRLFPEKEIMDGATRYMADVETPYAKVIPGTDIRVIPTPGHSAEHASLLVESGPNRIAVAGDVFWWEDGQRPNTDSQTLIDYPDAYAQDMSKLKESRRLLLNAADIIIPGHGRTFRVEK